MPEERSITLRYAIPGFSFIIVMLIASWRIIIVKISGAVQPDSSITGPLLAAFLTFVGGVPLGFLTSQLYFIWFNLSGGYEKRIVWSNLLKSRKPKKRLKSYLSKINVPKKFKGSEMIIFDYLLHSSENKEIIAYLHRRLDLIFALKSTIVALFAGLITGFLVVPWALGSDFSQTSIVNLSRGNLVLFLAVIAFAIILCLASRTPQSELKKMHEFLAQRFQPKIEQLVQDSNK